LRKTVKKMAESKWRILLKEVFETPTDFEQIIIEEGTENGIHKLKIVRIFKPKAGLPKLKPIRQYFFRRTSTRDGILEFSPNLPF